MYEIIMAMGIPSAMTGIFFWMLERRMEKREKKRTEKERVRERQEFLMVKKIGRAHV